MIDLNALRQLRHVAEKGSISRAARSLGMSQPSLTQSIRKLETHLNTQLLHRDSRGVSLTESGRLVLSAAGEIFEIVERLQGSLHSLEEEVAGEMVVGCHESLGAYFMPNFMRQLVSDYPKLHVTLWNDTSAKVRDAVVDRSIDFGLVVNPEPHPDLVLVQLFKDGVEAYVAASEPPVESRIDALVRIKQGPLIYAGRVQQCRDIIARLSADRCLPERRLECGDLEIVKSLVMAGLGVALLPRRVAMNRAEGRLTQLHPDLPSYPDEIYLLYRHDFHRTRGAIKLKDELVRYGKSMRDDDPDEHSMTLR